MRHGRSVQLPEQLTRLQRRTATSSRSFVRHERRYGSGQVFKTEIIIVYSRCTLRVRACVLSWRAEPLFEGERLRFPQVSHASGIENVSSDDGTGTLQSSDQPGGSIPRSCLHQHWSRRCRSMPWLRRKASESERVACARARCSSKWIASRPRRAAGTSTELQASAELQPAAETSQAAA